jgi:hypothetical protein
MPLPREMRRLRPGSLSLTVIEAAHVAFKDPGRNVAGPANLKCTVFLERKTGEVATPAHRKTEVPVWNSVFRTQIFDPERDTIVVHLKAHRDRMLHKGESNYHSPTRFLARARLPLFVVAANAALHGGSAECDLWLPMLERCAELSNENKQTIAAKLHVLASFEPMAMDDTSDDNADDAPPPVVSVVGGESKIERRPFLGGRALMSNDVLAAAFATTKSKQRRAVLVDGTGQLPPHLLLEDLQRPARPFLSVVPPIAIMPAVDSNVGINSSFVEPVLSRGDSSTGTVDFSDRGDEEASDTFMSLTAQSEDSASGGSKEKGTFGRVLILANAKTKVVDALTLELSAHGSPPQVLTFETAAIADRWRRAFAAFHAARGGWYLRDVREPKWSNVRDLGIAAQTLGVDNAALDLPPVVVTRAAMSRAIDAAMAGRSEYDAVAAPDFVVEALMASASDHDDDPRGELGSSSSSGSLLSSTASSSTLGSISVPQSTTSASTSATTSLQKFVNGITRAATKQHEQLKAMRRPSPARRDTNKSDDNDSAGDSGDRTAESSSGELATAASASGGGRARAAAGAKKPAVESQYGHAPPLREEEPAYMAPPSPFEPPSVRVDDPYVTQPSKSDAVVDKLLERSGSDTSNSVYDKVPDPANGGGGAVELPALPRASDSSGTPALPRKKDSTNSASMSSASAAARRQTSVMAVDKTTGLLGVYADPDASMSESDADAGPIADESSNVASEILEKLPRKYRVAIGDLGSLSEEIGRGVGGVVYRTRFREADVAVKMIESSNVDAVREFLEEAMLLLDLPPHPHVIQPIGLCGKPLCVVMMFCERGSLSKVLSSRTPPSLERRVAILRDVAAGMHHVAREGLIHKDLAARNVLLAAGDVALVADFGLSRLMNERGSVYDSGICSIKWSAPEAVTHKRFSTASDVWSFGVLIVEVMTCRPPLDNIPMSEYLLHFSAKQEEYRSQLISDLPMSVPMAVHDVAKKCLQTDVKARPAFNEVCQSLRSVLHVASDGKLQLIDHASEPVYV